MLKPTIPDNESERQQVLEDYNILDTLPEKEYDDITKIASLICNVPIALISFVDNERQWFKSKLGLEEQETSRDYSFCAHAINEPEKILEVCDVKHDKRFKDNPLVTDSPNIAFYAGVPLVSPSGHALGTLCVIDRVSRGLNEDQRKSLKSLARQVMSQLELRKQNNELEEERSKFQSLIEDVEDYVFETDETGTFHYCNPLISRDTGFSQKELLEMHYLDLVHEEDRQRVYEFYQEEIKQGSTDSYLEFRVRLKNDNGELIVGQKSKTVFSNGRMLKVRAIARNITKEVILQRRADENARLFQLISETAQDMVCMHDLKGAYTYVSPSVKDNLGYEPSELIGLTPYDLMHPDDIERAREQAHKPLLKGAKENYFEYRLRHKNGTYTWFESISTAIEDKQGNVSSLRSSTRNIQIRKEQETIINDQNVRLESFVKATPAPVAMFDRELKYLASSGQWLKTYGLEGKDIIGQCHYDIFPEIGDAWKRIHQECLQGATHKSDEDPFEREDGTVQWIKWEVKPWFNQNGEVGGIIMLTDDITQMKEQEIELREAKEKAEIASQAKANFLSVMSHEIRTPLNAVIGMSHLLMQEDPREDQLYGLKIIRFSGENLLSLVNDILDYNKIEAGKVQLEQVEFSLEELVNNIRHTHTYKADEKSISLKLLFDQDIPDITIGDPTRLSQILHNLLSNAIKFTKEGGVRITVEQVKKSDDSVGVLFEISDTGIGISEENLEKIFDRFVQAESHITRSFGGTGLGLSITKRLIEIMGGQIEVQSTLLKGSTFSFTLNFPYAVESASTDKQKVSYHPEADLSDLDIHVLLVEDNVANQVVATKFMNNWGVQVTLSKNGFEALEEIKSQQFDLVLMDLQMPLKDGLSAAKEIRAMEGEYFQNVPILALTASSDVSTLHRIKDFGMDDIVVKPFMPPKLHKMIQTYGVRNDQVKRTSISTERIDADFVKRSMLTFTGGDEEFTHSLLDSFIQNVKEFLELFPNYIEQRKVSEANFLVHKMRTTFKMSGQIQLLKRIEFCVETIDHESENPILPEILESCRKLLLVFESYLDQSFSNKG